MSALVGAYERRGRIPRLEYLPTLAPDVAAALLAAGFTVEDRLPVMECEKGEVKALPVPAGIDLLAPVTDRDVLDLVTAQHEAFDEIVFISRRVATS
jgi:hypothetical protein